jgi:hypothetical protein
MFSLILAASLLTGPVSSPVTLPSGPAPLHGVGRIVRHFRPKR